jgi:hypothetical protein
MGATLRQIQPVLNSTNDPLQLPETEERILAYFQESYMVPGLVIAPIIRNYQQ